MIELVGITILGEGFAWALKTWILESFRVAMDNYYTRYLRHPRIIAWSSKHKFYRHMLKPMLHGQLPVERLIPRHLNQNNYFEVPSEMYREFEEQRRGYQEMKEKNDDMYEKMTRLMEDMRRVPEANTTPIIADQHFGVSDISGFQSYQGFPSSFHTLPNNSSFFNMATPSNCQTPNQSNWLSPSNWQTPNPSYLGTPNSQPLIPSQPGTSNWQNPMTSYSPNLPPPIPSRRQDARILDPVTRDAYVMMTEFLLDLYDIYLDCYMKGYKLLSFFWPQLVPYLCTYRRERSWPEGWLSIDHMNSWIQILIRERTENANWTLAKSGTVCLHQENNRFMILTDPHNIGTLDGSVRPFPSWNDVTWVYMPINVGGVHWVTGAIDLAESIFYVFDSIESETRMLMLEKQVKLLQVKSKGSIDKLKGSDGIDHQGHMQFGFDSLSNASVDRCFQRTILRIMSRLMDVVLRDYAKSGQGTLPSQTVTNPREHVNAITTRSDKTYEGPSTPLVPTPVVSTPLKEPEQNPETSMDKVQKPSSESTAQVPPPEDHDSIFIEIPKPKAKKTVQEPNSPEPDSYQPKLPYPERMKVREKDKPSAQQSRFMKLFKQLRLEIGLRDALIEMPKFNKWLSTLLRNKEKLEEIAITTVNAECSAIILNKVPEKLEDPRKFLIPCALQELDRTNALADSGASINLLSHSIYKQLGFGALKPTRMTLELANRSVTHPMGIAEDVVVRVDGFTFLADFVVVNFEPNPRVLIILGRPFLRTAKALIDLYEEKLTLRVGNDELWQYHNHPRYLPPSSSPVKTSDNLEEFADELTLLDSFPLGNDDSILKKDVHKENFRVYSNPLFEFDDNFNSSNINPLFNEMDGDVENENSNVSNTDEPVLHNTPLTDKVEYDIDEIDAFLAVEVSSNLRMDVILFSMSSPQVKLFNTSFTRFAREHCKEYLSHFDFALLRFQLPCIENDDSEDEDNSTFLPDHELPNFDHQDNPSSPRPPQKPPDVKIRFEPDTAMINNFDVLNKDACFNLEEVPFALPKDNEFKRSVKLCDSVTKNKALHGRHPMWYRSLWQSNTSSKLSYWSSPQEEDHGYVKKAQGNEVFTLILLTKLTLKLSHHGLPRWQSACAKVI
ncbi:phospholipase-like protein [Tanacetum coccineum]